jgi:VCBS repeat-containing protein
LRTAALGAGLVGVVAVLLLASQAGAGPSPYTHTGSIAAYDADGQPMEVGYYERIGGVLPTYFGPPDLETLSWTAGPDGGPVASTAFIGQGDPSCLESEAYPYSTGPDPQGHCWNHVYGAAQSLPGTYGIIMPQSRAVGGETQVFDHWNVTNAATAVSCSRSGDMGLGVIDGFLGGPQYNPYAGDPFPSGPEYRIWTDVGNNVGMNATIEAHYARVSPDTSAPLVTIAAPVGCGVVQQDATLVADFACAEPAGLGSGVVSCVATDTTGMVQDGGQIDTSTAGARTLTVTATDAAGNSRSKSIGYTVVNDPPTALQLSNTLLQEERPAGTNVGTFSTTDPGPGDSFTYELVDGDGSADNASFTVDGDTLKTATPLDYETQAAYSIRVRTTDAGGASLEQKFTVTVTNEPEISPAEVAENQPPGTAVGTLTGVDCCLQGPAPTFELVAGEGDTDNASFAIAGNQLKTAASFDYETKQSYSIRVAQFGFGPILWLAGTLTIRVTDVNEPPTALALSNASVAENQAGGTSVGLLSTSDPDAGDAFSYALVSGTGSADNGSFTIDGATLKTAASFDYEAKSSYSIRVESTDEGGEKFSSQFTVTVTDLPDGPSFHGFFQPVDNLPTVNAVKAGSAMPIKFDLGGNQGLDVFADGYPQSRAISCVSGAALDDIESTVSAGGSSLSYNPTVNPPAGQYVYVWKTEKSWAGTCRQFDLKLRGGTTHSAKFKLK